MRYVLAAMTLMFVLGCEQRLTQKEWEERYKPKDVNEAKAMVYKEKGDVEIKKAAELGNIERICFVVIIGSIIAAVVLAYMQLQKLIFIPVAVLLGCLSGIALIELNEHYPSILPLAGGIFVLVIAAFAVYFLVVKMQAIGALKEVVANVEEIKKNSQAGHDAAAQTPPAPQLPKAPKILAQDLKDILNNQSPATKMLVAHIRGKFK